MEEEPERKMSICTRNRKNSVEYYMQQHHVMNFLKDNMFFNPHLKPVIHDDNEFKLAFQDSFKNDNANLDLVIDFVLEGGVNTNQSIKRKLSEGEAVDIEIFRL